MIRKAAAALIVTSLAGCGWSGEADIHGMHLHEAGHVFLGDREHADPRWWDCPALHGLSTGWANSHRNELGYLGEWAGDGGQGACMGSCRYAATPDGPRLAECTWP